jgi:endoglucanase
MHRGYAAWVAPVVAGLALTSSLTTTSGCASKSSGGGSSAVAKTVVLGKGTSTAGGVGAPAVPGKNVPAIKVDTVGYPASWKKIVVFNVPPEAAVVRDAKGNVALAIGPDQIVDRGVDAASKDPVWQVDISALKTPGVYTVEGKGPSGVVKSDKFAIGDGAHDDALLAGLKSFYFQRTRTALEKPYAVWKGDAYLRAKPSHVHEDVGWDLNDYPAKKHKFKVEGGWHDAGNYDMYVPSTAPSAQTLLMAYEWNPKAFDDRSLVIPESGNGIPDILDETKWGLVWVLSVQDDSGAFRHREAVMEFSPELPADEDKTVRWIAGVSTAATAKAVGALAMAARVYAPFDKKFAKRCEDAAKRGWAWLQKNPTRILAENKGSKQPLWDDEPGNTDVGARFIAAVEMWRSFREPSARAAAEQLMSAKETQAAEILSGAWVNVSRWGLVTLAFDDGSPKGLRAEARKRLLAAVADIRKRVETDDGYRCLSTLTDYYWAHNSNLMEKAHLLAVAGRLDPDAGWYTQAARDQVHWVNGRNPNGYSMTTRVGKGPERFYHMEWGPKEPPPPGFLLGGPNFADMPFLSPDAPAKALLWDNPAPLRSGLPAHSLWHWRQSDLWDGGFVAEGEWTKGWWTVSEPDILYSANYVLAAVAVR